MFPLIVQQGVGKRPTSPSSNSSVKFPKLATVSSNELLYEHLQKKCGAKEIQQISKNGFFKGDINGKYIQLDFQSDNFLDIYTTYMGNMKNLDSQSFEVVKKAVLERSILEDTLSIKDISCLLSNSVAGRFLETYICFNLPATELLNPSKQDMSLIDKLASNMVLSSTAFFTTSKLFESNFFIFRMYVVYISKNLTLWKSNWMYSPLMSPLKKTLLEIC